MPVVIYRQPWFWAVIIAVAAVLGFVVVIAASNRDRAAENSTTIVQQPSAPDTPTIVPTPAPETPSGITPPAPVEPERPERPEDPAKPAPPPTVKERVIIREKAVPVPVPAPPGANDNEEFQDTGLKRGLKWEDATWRASNKVTMDETQLKSAGMTENSTELFVEVNAVPPFSTVYVPVPDHAGTFVRYNKAR